MRTPILERRRHRVPARLATTVQAQLDDAAKRHARRVDLLRRHAVAWAVGTVLLTSLWVANQWHANGMVERFGHEGMRGQWNPTLWALGVGIWTLIVGIKALRVRLERPVTMAEVDSEVERMGRTDGLRVDGETAEEARLAAVRRLAGVRRVRFHVAAWALGMLILTPLWALIEWEDNGGFERFSSNSQPGSWEPWILPVGCIWVAAIVLLAVWLYFDGRSQRQPSRSG